MIWLLALGGLLVFWLWRSSQKPSNFPPGPFKLPILGSIPFLDPCQLHMVQKLKDKFGKVSGFFIGRHPFIVITDYEVAKEALKMEELTNRPSLEPIGEARPGAVYPELEGRVTGVILSQGRHWRDQRRFALRQLRDFGFGKTSMEDSLLLEVDTLITVLGKQTGQCLDLCDALSGSIVNSLWFIITSERLDIEDPKLIKLIRLVTRLFEEIPFTLPIPLLLPNPQWTKLPGLRQLALFDLAKEIFKDFGAFCQESIKEHQQTFKQQDMPRDFLDVYLKQIAEETDPTSSFYGQRGQDFLVNIVMELFMAGMETTSNSVLWVILYMIHHPDKQDRIHKELDSVVGKDRLPSFEDEEKLPYMRAVLHEAFRLSGLAFISIPHSTSKEVTIAGYTIPKDTTVICGLFTIMRDPKTWNRPDDFYPERFLNDNGIFNRSERVIPFGIGKRYCLGQSLAEKEYFLFFAGLMQKFTFEAAAGKKLPGYGLQDTKPKGSTRSAPKFFVNMQKR